MSWSVFGHDPRFFFDYTIHQRAEKAIGDNGRERERERRGRFSRDECSVIATRGTSCSVPGNPASLSFFHLLLLPLARRANWPRPKPWIGALPMHRCASVDWTFRRSLETASNPPVVCHLYRWIRRPVCVPTRSDSCQSRCIDPLPLSSILFPLNGHRNFFRPRVERFFYSSLVSTCRKGEAFRNDGKTGGRGEKKCRSV